jgi:GNAT superfamily N-acetyltransferase
LTSISGVDPAAARAAIPELAELLIDAVEGGSSVGFLAGLDRETAMRFWEGVVAAVERGTTLLFVARDEEGALLGTAQLILIQMPNQPHRAEVAKVLVHRRARRQGIAQRLLAAVEDAAREHGRTLLTLDTCTDSPAEQLYRREGWQPAGIIPGFALNPDGSICDTMYFWKRL